MRSQKKTDGEISIKGENTGGIVAVKKAEGQKCPRCWIYDISVGKNGQPVCDRCAQQLKIMKIDINQIEEAK